MGKWNQEAKQALLSHSFNVSSTALTIYDFLVDEHAINGSDRLRLKIILAGFFHDCAKSTVEFQEKYVRSAGQSPRLFEDQREDQVRTIVEEFAKENANELDKRLVDSVIWAVVHLGSTQSLGHLMDRNRPPLEDGDVLASQIIHVADTIMSLRDLRKASGAKVFTTEEGTFEVNGTKVYLDFHEVSPIRGVLTQYLHEAIEDVYANAGMRPLAWYYNGTLYMSLKKRRASGLTGESLVQQIGSSLKQMLDGLQEKMGRTSFGNLREQVVSKPEFLFFSEETVRAFWGYVFDRPFAHKQFGSPDDLEDNKRILLEGLERSYPAEDEERTLFRFQRVYVDFNLIVVMSGALKELEGRCSSETGKATKEKVLDLMENELEIDGRLFANLPLPVNTSSPEERLRWASVLMSSPLWANKLQWDSKLRNVLVKATQLMGSEWRKLGDSIESLTNKLAADIIHPLASETSLLEETKVITEAYEKGKLGRGTFTCQHCGSKSEVTAIASIFSVAEVYHDQLVAGGSLGGQNKIKVCSVCDFEFKLRGLFLPRFANPYTLIVLPQVAISRDAREEWQQLLMDLESSPVAEKYRPLRDLTWWAYKCSETPRAMVPLLGFIASSTNSNDWIPVKRRIKQLEKILARRYEDDGFMSAFADINIVQIDRQDIKNFSDLAEAIINKRVELRKDVEENLRVEQLQDKLVYNSPNFLLFLTSAEYQKDEPETVSKIRLIFMMLLIAKLFCSSVMTFSECRESSHLREIKGYALLPSDVSLKPLLDEFSDSNGWLPIEKLDDMLLRLSALFVINDILGKNGADFGMSTLLKSLKILAEEKLPGKLLVRLAQQAKEEWKGTAIQQMIKYLDVWTEGSVAKG